MLKLVLAHALYKVPGHNMRFGHEKTVRLCNKTQVRSVPQLVLCVVASDD